MNFSLNKKVKELCRERGMQLRDLAEQIGVAPESLSRAINGNPQLSTLENIADALGIAVGDLFESTRDKLNPHNIHAIITYNNKVYMAEGLAPLISTIDEIVADVNRAQATWQEIPNNPKLLK